MSETFRTTFWLLEAIPFILDGFPASEIQLLVRKWITSLVCNRLDGFYHVISMKISCILGFPKIGGKMENEVNQRVSAIERPKIKKRMGFCRFCFQNIKNFWNRPSSVWYLCLRPNNEIGTFRPTKRTGSMDITTTRLTRGGGFLAPITPDNTFLPACAHLPIDFSS